MLIEERANQMLNQLFIHCSNLLLGKISMDQFAERVAELAKEKLKAGRRGKSQDTERW